jgi:hypothetical protein
MPDPTAPPTPAAAAKAAKAENPLANLLLNVLLPVSVLSFCSKTPGPDAPIYALGPKLALIVAVALPVGYQIYDFIQRRKWNLFSLIGMVSVLLTGGLGLMRMSAQAFAWKEASMPLILAILIYLSDRSKKPLVRALLINPDLVNIDKLDKAIDAKQSRPAFDKLLRTSTLLLAATMLMSAVLNYFLAIYFLRGTEHDEVLYNAAIAKQTGWGWVVIGLPSMAMMLFAMMRLFKGLKSITGLDTDDILLPR